MLTRAIIHSFIILLLLM